MVVSHSPKPASSPMNSPGGHFAGVGDAQTPGDSPDFLGFTPMLNSTFTSIIKNLEKAGISIPSEVFGELENNIKSDLTALVTGVVNKFRSDMDATIDTMDQNSKYLNLCLFGVPEPPGEGVEDTEMVAVDLLNTKLELGDDCLHLNDIVRAKRVGKPPYNKGNKIRARPIVITFARFRTRMHVFMKKKLLVGTKLLLSEDLTATRRDIYGRAKHMVGRQYVWTLYGAIKISRNSAVHTIHTLKELEDFAAKFSLEFPTSPVFNSDRSPSLATHVSDVTTLKIQVTPTTQTRGVTNGASILTAVDTGSMTTTPMITNERGDQSPMGGNAKTGLYRQTDPLGSANRNGTPPGSQQGWGNRNRNSGNRKKKRN